VRFISQGGPGRERKGRKDDEEQVLEKRSKIQGDLGGRPLRANETREKNNAASYLTKEPYFSQKGRGLLRKKGRPAQAGTPTPQKQGIELLLSTAKTASGKGGNGNSGHTQGEKSSPLELPGSNGKAATKSTAAREKVKEGGKEIARGEMRYQNIKKRDAKVSTSGRERLRGSTGGVEGKNLRLEKQGKKTVSSTLKNPSRQARRPGEGGKSGGTKGHCNRDRQGDSKTKMNPPQKRLLQILEWEKRTGTMTTDGDKTAEQR